MIWYPCHACPPPCPAGAPDDGVQPASVFMSVRPSDILHISVVIRVNVWMNVCAKVSLVSPSQKTSPGAMPEVVPPPPKKRKVFKILLGSHSGRPSPSGPAGELPAWVEALLANGGRTWMGSGSVCTAQWGFVMCVCVCVEDLCKGDPRSRRIGGVFAEALSSPSLAPCFGGCRP